jgi:D-aminoacyl-tRNA deacylase
MKALLQRVKEAEVLVDGKQVSRIGPGFLTLLGIVKGDDEARLRRLVQKIVELRVFEDSAGKMNLSLLDTKGEHLIVSQFTLAADCSAGRRPSFTGAEHPDLARPLVDKAVELSRTLGVPTCTGVFGAHMELRLVNDGPVTILLEA